MDKFWENYITTRPADSKGAFEEFKQMNQDPRPTIPGPRYAKAEFSPVFDPDLEQSEFLRPGETLEDWKPNPFLKPHADGGRAGYNDGQLVRNTVDGSRAGYNGKKPYLDQAKFIEEFTTQRINGDMTGPNFVEYLNENYSPSTQTDAFTIDNVDRRLRKAQEKKLIAKDIVTKGSTADRALTPEKYISVIGEEEYARLKDSPTKLTNRYEFELNKKNNPNFLDIRKERTKKWKASLTPDQYREKVTIPAAEYKAKKFPTKFAVNRNNAKSMAWKDLVSRTYEAKGDSYFKFETPLEKGKNYNTADMKDIVLKDKQGNRFTFDTLFDDVKKVAGEVEFKNFKNTYDQRAFLNKEGITTELNKLYGNKPGARKSVFNVQHIEGFNKAPFKVHLTFADQNLNEAYSRRTFTTDFGRATTYSQKKAAINNYYKSLGPDIVAQIGRKPKGEAKTLINLLDKSGIKLTDTQRAGALDLSTAEGRLANRQKGTVKILNKILENNKIYDLSELAKEDPAGFLKAVKEHKLASKILNKPGLVKGALKGVSGWAKKELGPMGWIGSIATIDSAFGLHALGQGKTPLQALDTTLWFLPKSVLKADEKMFKNVYEKAGYTEEDFGEFQKWMKLEDLDQQYFKSSDKLEFMKSQVLEPEKKTVLEKGLRKEMDLQKDSPYANMGWMNPMSAITSEEERTGEHRHYGRAVDEHNRILTESTDVYESLKDPEKSLKDLDYSRKLAAMEEANRKKQMQLQGWQGYGLGDKAIEEMLNRAGKGDILFPEYVHPIEGPSVSQEQMLATGLYPHASGGRAGYMGGGIAAIRKPHAIPPERQGLRSIMINGKKS